MAAFPSMVARPAPKTPMPQALYEEAGEHDVEEHGADGQNHRGHRIPLGLAHGLERRKMNVNVSSKERTRR